MNRRSFILSISATAALTALGCSNGEKQKRENNPVFINGLTFEEHRDELNDRLFHEYLPFWENGGYDKQFGGFICNLDKNGIPVDDSKFIWYQGRAIWVYSFLYNNFGRNARHLEIARRTRDFMVKYMYTGNGQWAEKVHRKGDVIKARHFQFDKPLEVFCFLTPKTGLKWSVVVYALHKWLLSYYPYSSRKYE